MAGLQPRVSVVIATRNRPERLAAALASLRAQTLDASLFDIVVVDDASDDPAVGQTLALAATAGGPRLHVINRATAGGPAPARNEGWQAATGELIAFTDDDCELTPGWLRAGLEEWDGTATCFVQGRTAPIPREVPSLGLYAYSIDVPEMSAEFQTCNIFYPRALLQAMGGFDAVTHPTSGEDTDLAWRAIAAGATPRFAAAALAHHAVVPMSRRRMIKRAWNFSDAIIPFGAHPDLRRRRLIRNLFWNWSHYLWLRGAVALVLPRRLWPVSLWLAWPLIAFQLQRARSQGGGATDLPWLLAYDTVEVAAVMRGAMRGRTLVI